MDCHGLSWTVMDCQGRSRTVKDCHGLSYKLYFTYCLVTDGRTDRLTLVLVKLLSRLKSNIQREAKYFFDPRVNLSSSLPQVRFLPLFDYSRTVGSKKFLGTPKNTKK